MPRVCTDDAMNTFMRLSVLVKSSFKSNDDFKSIPRFFIGDPINLAEVLNLPFI